MSDLEKLCVLMHNKNLLEDVRQSTRHKYLRMQRYARRVADGYDFKNPKRETVYWSDYRTEKRTPRLMVPKSWAKLKKNDIKHLVFKSKVEHQVAMLAIHEYTREFGKQIRDLLKKNKWHMDRCRHNHHYTGVYARGENGAFLRFITTRQQIQDIANKVTAEKILLGVDNG